MLYDKPNKQILEEMDRIVIGHNKAKKLLISLVNRSKLSHKLKWIDEKAPIEKMNLLLIGASGTGKTYLLETLSSICDFPLYKVDASRLNPAANKSYSVLDLEEDLIQFAKFLISRYPDRYFSVDGVLDQLVVFMDEIDKLAAPFGSSDGWQEKTQGELLTMIENTELFKNTSFVFAGAFTKLRTKEIKTPMGFSATEETSEVGEITEKDLIEYGIMPELMGRITAFNELDVLTEEMMTTILETQLLPRKLRDISFLIPNVEQNITEEDKHTFVRNAMDSDQGVRHMKRALGEFFLDMEFNFEDHRQLITTDTETTETIDCP